MKTCPHCGKANDPSAFYCEACGQIIEKGAGSDLYTVNRQEEMYGVTQRSTPDAVYPSSSYQEAPAYATPATYDPYGAQEIPTPYVQQSMGIQTPCYATPMYPPPPVEKKRSAGNIILSTVLYLFALSNASFGVASFTMGFIRVDTAIGLAFCVPLLIGLIALIPILIAYKKPRFTSWKRLLITLGLAVVGVITLFIAAGLSGLAPDHESALYIYMGGTFTIFGLLMMISAIF